MTRGSLPVLALVACLLLPAAAGASRSQLSIIQDDAVFWGATRHDSSLAMAEAKALGADAVRTNVVWQYVSPAKHSNRKPAGFDVADPDSPGYNWNAYDHLARLAHDNGLKLLITISGPIPDWASKQPRRCSRNCLWKPRVDLFGRFVEAVARRYRDDVWMYSIWNEPNLSKWLLPHKAWTRYGTVDVAGRMYRKLWLAAYRAIARHNPSKRNAVLYGETAAISDPASMLLAGLCLDRFGRPFSGALRRLQGCPVHPRKLPIAGIAHHPYNRLATGSWSTRSKASGPLSIAHMPRLHRLLRAAAHYRRIPSGRGIWIDEFGFQSRPPDPVSGLELFRHARVLNETERLFWGDPLVRSVSQYELYDPPNFHMFQTGLRLKNGRKKPAYDAYRMPLVVTRLARNRVEIWGAVRPAAFSTQVQLVGRTGGGSVRLVRNLLTNDQGYYRYRIRYPGAARLRWRVGWKRLTAVGVPETIKSRFAHAGVRPRYDPAR